MASREPDYISLREAAQITGYSPDYIGQLIRAGKLHGKQVFSNVAWMTTKSALEEYAQKDRKQEKVEKKGWSLKKYSIDSLTNLYTYGMWGVAGILGLCIVGMLYVLAVSIDNKIEKRYLEKIQYDREI
jgi:hypothetical protein